MAAAILFLLSVNPPPFLLSCSDPLKTNEARDKGVRMEVRTTSYRNPLTLT